MNRDFKPINTTEGWQISNAPVFGMAPLIASMDIFDQVGMVEINNKGQKISNYLSYLITEKLPQVKIITPDEHGCQLSLIVPNGQSVFNKISQRGIVCDWREPDVIRFAPHPLFNTYLDIFNVVKVLQDTISNG